MFKGHKSKDGRANNSPPVHSRFQPGQSGNRRGRPKGTLNFKTDLQDTLKERVAIREGETVKRVSKQKALIMKLASQGLDDNYKAALALLEKAERLLGEEAEYAAESIEELSAEDEAVLQASLHRYRKPMTSLEPEPMNKDEEESEELEEWECELDRGQGTVEGEQNIGGDDCDW